VRVKPCSRIAIGLIIAWPGSATLGNDMPMSAWVAIDETQLDELRGGFDTSSGLRVSFGLEREAYVNGELVAQSSAVIPDVGAMTAEQAAAFQQAVSGVLLIQNGPNNAVDLTEWMPGSTVIQNTLNDQHIVTMTTINASVNSLALYQGLNVHESLQQVLNTGMGAR
jgi:hypothetical protein